MNDFYSLNEYIKDIVVDAKISVSEFYEKNDPSAMPTPYANIVNYYDLRKSYNIQFPSEVDRIDRVTQYYILSRFISQLSISRVGIVAVLKIDVPPRPEIDEKYWNRSCPALLIGVCSNETMHATHPYETAIVLFDHFDGKLEFFEITNINIWQEFVDNTSIFRDFLLFSSISESSGSFDIATSITMLKNHGFKMFSDPSEAESFFLTQGNFVMAPSFTYADLGLLN